MKHIVQIALTLMFLMPFCISGYAQSIDPVLLEIMGQSRDNEKIRVFVVMRQQYDQEQLNRHAAFFTTRAERRDFVVNELMRFADVTQYDLRRSLGELQHSNLVSEPKVLWIANAVSFEATSGAILSLADRSDIRIIGFDEERNWLPDGEESSPAISNRAIATNVTQVHADQVWDLGYTGQGVVVAVIDTGVNYHHLDLADHLWDGGDEFPNHGFDIYNNDNNPIDDHGHGTHCAGTLCGDGTAGTQTGIAPDATLMCVKCLSSLGRCNDSHLINGIQWAIEHGCDVISMSLGGHEHSSAEQTILRNACVNVLTAGVIASIAAGNEGDELNQYPIPDNIGLPGGCPPPYLDTVQQQNAGGLSCSVCVGAVNSNDEAAYFTSHGPRTWVDSDYADYPYTEGSPSEFGLIRPDVCAPGVSIKSAYYGNNTGYTTKSGTSMATPCVAGCMALMLSKNIDATPADLCRILEETAVPLSNGKSNIYGYGRVDALAAVNALSSGPLKFESFAISDELGNNDGKMNAGEAITFDFSLTNISDMALDSVSMALFTESDYVTITNGTAILPHFDVGQTQTVEDLFAFSLTDDAPAKKTIQFTAEVYVDGVPTETFRLGAMVYGPTLRLVEVTVLNDDNDNGVLDAGETANLHFVVSNVGNEPADSVVGTLSTPYPYLSINEAVGNYGDIEVNGQDSAHFTVTLDSTIFESYNIVFTLDLVDVGQKHTLLEFELWKKAVTLSSNPSEGGTLNGAGPYGQGQSCTITATANNGYAFVSWTLNGTVVSYLPTYTFTVIGEAEYVASFQEVTNGMVIGEGSGTSVFFPGYSFYGYNLSQQIYTADELDMEAGELSSVSFFNTGDSKTRTYTIYMVNTDKTAFENSYDWITVTEADQVFSGSVTMAAGCWTTIYFGTPFAYDGISNIALIVDDNTGSWSSGMSCRTFDVDGSQAIHVYSDGTNYNPYNSSGYNGTLMSLKNQIVLGFPYTITATANPIEGGVVNGSGSYSFGAPCTLTATPNADYYFLNWTEDGTVVSYDVAYPFTVEGDRSLVANFAEGSSMCTVYFDLFDSFGDGWNDNYLVVDYGDGNVEQFTLESGSASSYFREVATGTTLILTWISGLWTNECSFDIKFENGVPIYHGLNLSASFQQELNINCAIATVPHTITTTVDPEEGGSVEGEGTYESGSNITLTATPNEGYTFCYWSENGQQVSTEASYSFIVTTNRDLVARFSLPLNISIATNMSEGGTATGAGLFDYGTTCTLTATPTVGYLFLNWSRNGEVVSCNASYSFIVTEDVEIEAVFMPLEGVLVGSGEATNMYLPSYSFFNYSLTQQIYTPDEIGLAGSITTVAYYNAGNTKTRSYDIYMVHTDKASFSNNMDWIAVSEADRVYTGSVTMTKGYWTTIVLDRPFVYDGTSNLAIVIDDNMGRWTGSPDMSCRVFDAVDSQAIRVYSDTHNFDPYNSSDYIGTRHSVKNQMILGITPSAITQTTELSFGWNWFSTFIAIDDPNEGMLMLQEALGGNAEQIKARNGQYAEYDDEEEEWFGNLTGLTSENMYMTYVTNDCTIALVGMPVSSTYHEITIVPGWNWIGFPCATEMSVAEAFAAFEAEEDDELKGRGSYATFDGEVWFGGLTTLQPGQGYMYYSNSSVTKTLIFPSGAK